MSLNAPACALYGSPLSRLKFASFVIILLGVMLFLSISSIVNNIIASTSTKGGIPIFLMALAWSGFLCIIPIAILWFLDRREPESKWLYAIAEGVICTGARCSVSNRRRSGGFAVTSLNLPMVANN